MHNKVDFGQGLEVAEVDEMRSELREVRQASRVYIIVAVFAIVAVVGLIFGFQIAKLQQSNSQADAVLSHAVAEREDANQSDCRLSSVGIDDKWMEKFGVSAALRLSEAPAAVKDQSSKDEDYRLNRNLPSFSFPIKSSWLDMERLIRLRTGELLLRFQPRLAIVIDDWGHDWAAAQDFLDLDIPFTAAVLPYRTKTDEMISKLRQKGLEIILHLPMEPQNPNIEIGEGAITTDLNENEIRAKVEDALRAVDGAVGVNNHMGSKATSDPKVMQAVFDVFIDSDLYFIDSWTAPTSVAGQMAWERGIPTATNQAFLDHYDDVEKVKSQLERLIRLARRDGQALGIGHVRPQTYRALVEMKPRFKEAGVVLVPASKVVSARPVVETID